MTSNSGEYVSVTVRQPDPPSGYGRHGSLFPGFDDLPTWRWLIIGNLWALLPVLLLILVLWLPYQFYIALGAPLARIPDPAWAGAGYWVFGALVIGGSISLHELLHALGLWLAGQRTRIRYAFGYFYATTDGFLTRRQYIIMALLPLSVITLLGGVLLLVLPPRLGQVMLIAVLLNAAASIGDCVVALSVLRFTSEALFADRGGIVVFLPHESLRKQN